MTRREERKNGHGDELITEDEEDMEYPVVKTAWILSFILSPMPAPLLYTGIGYG